MNHSLRNRRTARGQTLTSYGLIIAAIAIVTIVVITALGGSVSDKFTQVNDGFGGATEAAAPPFAITSASAVLTNSVGDCFDATGGTCQAEVEVTINVVGGTAPYFYAIDDAGVYSDAETSTTWTGIAEVTCDGTDQSLTVSVNDDGPEDRQFSSVEVNATCPVTE